MRKAIRDHAVAFAAIVGLVVIALPVALYVVQQQRLRIPLVDPDPVRIEVVLPEANAVTPGQGQTAQVAGVNVGSIADVRLEDGRAVVGLDIDPEYDDLVHTDARALLRPRTGLKDMYVQIFPGSARAPLIEEGGRIEVASTATDVDLDEILAMLDERTRDHLRLLVAGTGEGLRGNGRRLAEVFRRYAPTMRDLARVNRAVAAGQGELRRVVRNLGRLNERLADRPEDLSELVDTASATFGAFASEEDDLRATVTELAPTLAQATTTLRGVGPLARELGPATRALVPAVQALDEANGQVRPFAREAAPAVAGRIRPFVRAARPLARELAPAAGALAATLPEVRRGGRPLDRFLNQLAFNPGGAEGPGVAGREEGFLFWTAWVAHQGLNLQNIEDANGPLRPVLLGGTCQTLSSLITGEPALEFALNLSPALATQCGDPASPSVTPAAAGALRPRIRPFLPDAPPTTP